MYRRYKEINTDRLKDSIDTVSFYSRETEHLVRNQPGWQSTLCPFHDDTHPSLRVLVPDGAYTCLACGAKGGDVITFTEQKHDMDFLAAARYLQQEYGGAI